MTAPDWHGEMERIRTEHESQRQVIRRRLWATMALNVLVFAIFIVVVFISRWAAYVVIGLSLCWVVFSLWKTRPGPCAVCGRRRSIAIPRAGWTTPAWWDLRPPSRQFTTWACTEHLTPVIHQVLLERAERLSRGER